MKIKHTLLLLPLASALLLGACNEDISTIGSSLVGGEVSIMIDSIPLVAESRPTPITSERASKIDARTTNCLLGRFDVEQYGKLESEFIARMMCSSAINFPDSLNVNRVDSCKLLLRTFRSSVIGDSLAPQQVTVYQLKADLPDIDTISNQFNPAGYYEPDALGKRTFVLSEVGMDGVKNSDSSVITIQVPLGDDNGKEWGQKIVSEYRDHPETFAWPANFKEFFGGIYAKQTFGRGCMAGIASAAINVYYHTLSDVTNTDSDGNSTTVQTHVCDSITPFAMALEVLSSNILSYSPSATIEGLAAQEPIIVAPAGYNCQLTFPTKALVEKYFENDKSLGVVSDLTFNLPAEIIDNDFNIAPPPYLLMVKESDYDTFFAENKLPDSKNSFYAAYSVSTGSYKFSSMRDFILPIVNQSEEAAKAEPDTKFYLVPVQITQETYSSSSYYSSSYSVIVDCAPYIVKPAMVKLKPEEAEIVFSFSYQKMY